MTDPRIPKGRKIATALISMNLMSNRHQMLSWGLYGGSEGATGATLFKLKGKDEW